MHATASRHRAGPPALPGRNVLAKDGFPKLEGVSTLFEMFESSVRRFGDCDCLGWRPQEGDSFGPYKWWTYREVHGAQPRRKGAPAPHAATPCGQWWHCHVAERLCVQAAPGASKTGAGLSLNLWITCDLLTWSHKALHLFLSLPVRARAERAMSDACSLLGADRQRAQAAVDGHAC